MRAKPRKSVSAERDSYAHHCQHHRIDLALNRKIFTRRGTGLAYPFPWDCIALAMSVADAHIPGDACQLTGEVTRTVSRTVSAAVWRNRFSAKGCHHMRIGSRQIVHPRRGAHPTRQPSSDWTRRPELISGQLFKNGRRWLTLAMDGLSWWP